MWLQVPAFISGEHYVAELQTLLVRLLRRVLLYSAVCGLAAWLVHTLGISSTQYTLEQQVLTSVAVGAIAGLLAELNEKVVPRLLAAQFAEPREKNPTDAAQAVDHHPSG